MGVDGISMLFVILTTFLMPLCILASWESDPDARQGIHDRVSGARNDDDRRLLRARSRAVLSCSSRRPDPDVHHHRRLGRRARVYASFKFFLYTLLGSVLMLLAMMAMYWQAGTTDIVELC
jgi:NADH-quinone oxidoreductase subunit M